MPDLGGIVKQHGSVRKYRVDLVLEHADGYIHKIASAPIINKNGFSADDMHRELIKTAGILSVAPIETQ